MADHQARTLGVDWEAREGPGVPADALVPIDLVLLSHHEHPDNLDAPPPS